MPIELRMLGTKCNIGCTYCYQNPLRNSGNGNSGFNFELVKSKLSEIGEPFVLWGGEPLLLPIQQIEELFKLGMETYDYNAILTNGVLITDEHIELFRKYNVKVSISIDGPDELNDVRWAGTLEKTREATRKTLEAIIKLVENNICLGLNIQVSRCNSSEERFPKMLEWMKGLDKLGIDFVRLHIMEIDYSKKLEIYAFTENEHPEVFARYRAAEKTFKNLKFDLFNGMKDMLLGNELNDDCYWSGCDPYTTESVRGMDGEGRSSNCGLTDKEGINFQKPIDPGYERYIALFHTPEEYGGCKDCRFFLACKGQCPGTAINGDWRNKSGNCKVWKRIYTEIESEIMHEGKTPVSLDPRRKVWENIMIDNWGKGINLWLGEIVSTHP